MGTTLRKEPEGMSDYSRMAELLRKASLPYSMPSLEQTGGSGGLGTPCLIVEVRPSHGSRHPCITTQQTAYGEKLTFVHRLMYHRLYGGSPHQGTHIAQLCGQPRCCAPDHLLPVLCEALAPFRKRLKAALAKHPPVYLPPPDKSPRARSRAKVEGDSSEDNPSHHNRPWH